MNFRAETDDFAPLKLLELEYTHPGSFFSCIQSLQPWITLYAIGRIGLGSRHQP